MSCFVIISRKTRVIRRQCGGGLRVMLSYGTLHAATVLFCGGVAARAAEPGPTANQDLIARPLPNALTQVPVGGHDIAVYGLKSEKGVQILPTFEWISDKTQVTIVDTPDGNIPANSVLTITLVMTPAWVRDAVAAQLQDRGKNIHDPELKAIFSNITSAQVNVCPLKSLIITDTTPHKAIMFDTLKFSDPRSGQISLSASVPKADVDQVKKEISEGKRHFKVDLVAYATQTKSTKISVDFKIVMQTAAWRRIVGDVGATEGWRTNRVERDQLLTLKSEIRSGLSTSVIFEGGDPNPTDLPDLYRQIDKFVDECFAIKLDDGPAWDRLKTFGFNWDDVTASKVTRLVRKLHDDVKKRDENAVAGDLKAAAELGLFRGEGEAAFSSKTLTERSDLHDFVLEVEGDVSCPVGLKIKTADKSLIDRASSIVNSTVHLTPTSMSETIADLSTALFPGVPANYIAELEMKLIKQSDALSKQADELRELALDEKRHREEHGELQVDVNPQQGVAHKGNLAKIRMNRWYLVFTEADLPQPDAKLKTATFETKYLGTRAHLIVATDIKIDLVDPGNPGAGRGIYFQVSANDRDFPGEHGLSFTIRYSYDHTGPGLTP